jgi:hypothetical protein
MWPEAKMAKFYDMTFTSATGGAFVFGFSLEAMPPEFAKTITSGIRTSLLNQDIVLQLTFPAPLGTPQRIDSFLQSDVIISSQGEGRELRIQY